MERDEFLKETEELIGGKKDSKKQRSNRSKMVGVKSALIFRDNVIMTSFDKSNFSRVEKVVQQNKVIINKQTPATYTATIKGDILNAQDKGKKIFITKDNNIQEAECETNITNNLSVSKKTGRPIGEDYINIKEQLENAFFGRAFHHDNIHVQIAYNILDIKKILGAYIGNVSYILNNLTWNQKEMPSDFDLVGNTIPKFTYDEFITAGKTDESIKLKVQNFEKFIKKASPYFGFFNHVFKSSKNEKEAKDNNAHNYNVIRVIASLRQFCAHGNILDLNKYIKDDLRAFLDEQYAIKINEITDHFLENSALNISILSSLYPDMDIDKLIIAYYNFAIRKTSKNIGLNVTTIRENIYETHVPVINEEKQTKHKGKSDILGALKKINTIYDFVITQYLLDCKSVKQDGKTLLEEYINRFRRAAGNEEMKKILYKQLAEEIYSNCPTLSNLSLDNILGETKGFEDKMRYIDKKWLIKKYEISSNTDYLCKALFIFSGFLDYKENNELFSELITKFSEIYDLINVYVSVNNKPIEFVSNGIFGLTCARTAESLNIIKSLANKKLPLPDEDTAKQRMFLDAAALLGYDTSDIEQYQKDENGKYVLSNNKPLTTEEFDNAWISIYGTEQDHPLRNFICNNIIKSSRFVYLVKYCNVKTCRKFAENDGIVNLVLKRLPDTQIKRYYKLITGEDCSDYDQARNALVKALVGLDFTTLYNNRNKYKGEGGQEKARMQSLLSLYLTVIYIANKNLVKASSRYFIAFSCLERDCWFMTGNDIKTDYLQVTNQKLSKDRYKKRVYDYLSKNKNRAEELAKVFVRLNNTNLYFYNAYRNNIEHFTAVTKAYKYLNDYVFTDDVSYYGLFNYVMQRVLMETYQSASAPEWLKNIFEGITKYKSYSKDLIKILNMPFAYNLPRYKNLSVEYLFNDLDEKAQERTRKKEKKSEK